LWNEWQKKPTINWWVRVMVFMPLSTIFQLYHSGQFYLPRRIQWTCHKPFTRTLYSWTLCGCCSILIWCNHTGPRCRYIICLLLTYSFSWKQVLKITTTGFHICKSSIIDIVISKERWCVWLPLAINCLRK
jgi:hypothetical protein